jgi:trimeric autotransporter adhesin
MREVATVMSKAPTRKRSLIGGANAAAYLVCTGLSGLLFMSPAQAQLLRGTLDTSGNGILGTGLGISTSAPGSGILGTGLQVSTGGTGLLGTGLGLGTTAPGSGVLGTGLQVGTSGTGILGTGLLIGTTGPGDGLLGTGLTLGTAGAGGGCGTCGGGGTGGGGAGGSQNVYIVTGNVTQSQGQTIVSDLRLTSFSEITGVAANNTSGQAGPSATGGDALAVGYGSSASGTAATAVGTGASASNTGSVALGYAAAAQGVGSTAIGTASAAVGDGSTALGFVAGATGSGSTAIGAAASAAGNSSVALGNGAGANQANAIAIGANVKTTRAGQVAIGNAGNTYTLAGIASQASAAAQSGPTNFVTTDANGNLAASAYGPSTIAGLGSRIDSVQSQVNNLEAKTDAVQRYAIQTRKEARQGVAMAIAMATAPMPSAPGKTTWATNGATYRGEWAGGVAVAHRLPTCCVPIAITAGVAYGGDNALGARAGLAGEF